MRFWRLPKNTTEHITYHTNLFADTQHEKALKPVTKDEIKVIVSTKTPMGLNNHTTHLPRHKSNREVRKIFTNGIQQV
jgi:hypothetical protein